MTLTLGSGPPRPVVRSCCSRRGCRCVTTCRSRQTLPAGALVAGGGRVQDAAWSLPHPMPEALAAAEHSCFYGDKVHVEVDGERIR